MNEPKNNRILSTLTSQVYENLNKHFELVPLALGELLVDANREIEFLHFPIKGVVSLISVMQDGSTTEVGLIGTEGMTGMPQFLGNGVSNNRSVVQLKGTAIKISAEVLRVEFERSLLLQRLLLDYNLKLFNQVSQCASCNNHHSVKQRAARWLLMLDDRVDGELLTMTQQLLSQMLGVRRSGVSEVASEIQQQGIINYSRGNITILDREALESIACECYLFLKE